MKLLFPLLLLPFCCQAAEVKLTPSFEFRGEPYYIAPAPIMKSSSMANRFTGPLKRADGSKTEIFIGYTKTTNLERSARAFEKWAKTRPNVTFRTSPLQTQGQTEEIVFALLLKDPEKKTSTTDVWRLTKSKNSLFARRTNIAHTETEPAAQITMAKNFPQNAIKEMIEFSNLPQFAVMLGKPKGPEDKPAVNPEGKTILANKVYVEKNYAGKGSPPPVRAPFKIIIPKKFAAKPIASDRTESGELLRLLQTDENGEATESISFFNLSGPARKDTAPSLALLSMFVETLFVGPQILAKGGKVLTRYQSEINGLHAAVILTQTPRENQKPIYHQYILIPRPESEHGIYAIIRVDPEKSPDVKSIDDLDALNGFASEILATFTFTEKLAKE